MIRSLTASIPPGAETGIWQLLGFLADVEACGKRMAELTAIRDEIHAREEALAKGQAELAAAQTEIEERKAAADDAEAALRTARAELERDSASATAEIETARNALSREQAGLSSDRAAFDKEKVAEIGARGERAAAMRAQDDEIKARAIAVVDREAAASKALAEAEALKAEHERLVENAKKLLAGG